MMVNVFFTFLKKPIPNYFILSFAGSLLILGILVLLYAPIQAFDFLNWDDDAYIHNEPVVLKGISDESLNYAFTKFDNPYFMPLTRISFMLDVSLFGLDNPGGFHLTNLILHIVNSLLLFLIIKQATSRFYPALFVAILWGIHPQHIEAVAWIAERKEVLAGVFGLISLFFYQQFTASGKKLCYFVAFIAFAASLFSKPVWITLPVLLILWDYFPLHRFSRELIFQRLLEKLPFFILSGVYAFVFIMFLRIDDSPASFFSAPPWDVRWLLLFEGLGKYLMATFLPLNLIPFYPYPENIHLIRIVSWVLLLILILWFSWKNRLRHPGFLMAILWFIIALSPAMMLILSPKGEAVFTADRFTYLPHIGFFTGVVICGAKWLKQQSVIVVRSGVVIAIMILIITYGITQITLPHWKSPEALWTYTLKHSSGRGKAYILGLLGSSYVEKKKYSQALQVFKQAHKIDPISFVHPFFIGNILRDGYGQRKEAYLWHDKILTDSPASAVFLFNYGKAEYLSGRYSRAELYLLHASKRGFEEKMKLDHSELYVLLGLAQARNKKYQAAVDSFSTARLPVEEQLSICKFLSNSIFEPSHSLSSKRKDEPLRIFCSYK